MLGRAGPPLKNLDQLIASLEDRIGIVERDAASLSQDQLLSATLEQVVPQLLLKPLQLNGQGGLRQVQEFCGPGQTTLVRNAVEQAQMMIIQDRHRSYLQERTIRSNI